MRPTTVAAGALIQKHGAEMYASALKIALQFEPEQRDKTRLLKTRLFVESTTPLGETTREKFPSSLIGTRPVAVYRFTEEQMKDEDLPLDTWQPKKDTLNIPELPARKPQTLTVLLTRSSGPIKTARAETWKQDIENKMIKATQQYLPDLLDEDNFRLDREFALMVKNTPILLSKSKLWWHAHVIGSSCNAFPQSNSHKHFTSVLRALLSFSDGVKLTIVTVNLDNITDDPTNILKLRDVPGLDTTIHIAITETYANLIALHSNGRYLAWLSASLPEFENAMGEADGIGSDQNDKSEDFSNMAKWHHAPKMLACNKYTVLA